MPFLSPNQPSKVKAVKGKYHIPWICLPQAHLGVFHLCLWPLIAPGGGLPCLSSASDASTPNEKLNYTDYKACIWIIGRPNLFLCAIWLEVQIFSSPLSHAKSDDAQLANLIKALNYWTTVTIPALFFIIPYWDSSIHPLSSCHFFPFPLTLRSTTNHILSFCVTSAFWTASLSWDSDSLNTKDHQ